LKKYKLLFLVALFISGCVTIPTAEKYNQQLQQFIGLHVSYIEKSMGYPTSKTETFNGDIVYVYDKSSTYTTPTQSRTTYTPAVTAGGVVYVPAKSKTSTTGGNIIIHNCSTFFTINKVTGIIEHIRFEGNACKAR